MPRSAWRRPGLGRHDALPISQARLECLCRRDRRSRYAFGHPVNPDGRRDQLAAQCRVRPGGGLGWEDTTLFRSLKHGWNAYVDAIADPDTRSAIRLTLMVAGISLPLNAAFGLAAAWVGKTRRSSDLSSTAGMLMSTRSPIPIRVRPSG